MQELNKIFNITNEKILLIMEDQKFYKLQVESKGGGGLCDKPN